MNQIVKAEAPPVPLRYEDIERLAASIAKSGLFGMKTTDQALALMMIAHAEGLHPALAARDYDIINGRPAKKAEAMMRDFLRAGGKIEWHALSDTIADATFSHPQGGTVRVPWDMERATKAGLAGNQNYKKYPRQMLRSRTVSEGVRTVWPLATSGMFVPEEAADIPADPFTGTTIDAAPEQPPQRAADASTTRGEHVAEPPKRTIRQFLDGLRLAVADAKRAPDAAEQMDRVLCSDEVMQARDKLKNGALEELTNIISDGLRAVTPIENDPQNAANPDAADEPELPPVEIKGSQYAGV